MLEEDPCGCCENAGEKNMIQISQPLKPISTEKSFFIYVLNLILFLFSVSHRNQREGKSIPICQ